MKIIIKPIGNTDNDVIEELKERLNHTFGCGIEITPVFTRLDKTYEAEREQYLAPALLTEIQESDAAKGKMVLGITDVDLYAPKLNFVFGAADVTTSTAIISLHRLRQEYQGFPSDKALFMDRATKEAVHELGHLFGLEHCADTKCVMLFSNCLADTDQKQTTFCSQCRPKLIK